MTPRHRTTFAVAAPFVFAACALAAAPACSGGSDAAQSEDDAVRGGCHGRKCDASAAGDAGGSSSSDAASSGADASTTSDGGGASGGGGDSGGGGTGTGDDASTSGGTSFVLAAVGDINPSSVFGATTNPGLTAQTIRNIAPTYFLGLGDFQYTQGTLTAILGGYDKNFGDLKARTLPTAGPTHDVASATDELGYASYWGRDGFKGYSVDVGNWHIVQLPSAAYRYAVDPAGVLSWLKADLAASTKPCTLAFWHEPYWSRSTSTHPTGSDGILTSAEKPWLDALYAAGAELILNGHQHNYQRFAPMRPDGTPDPNGLREIVSGVGGIGFYTFDGTAPNVEASSDNTYGVLKVTLGSSGYTWQFVPNTSGFTDSGSGTCH